MEENRAHLAKVVSDKNIQPISRPGTEMPPGILSMMPLNSNPHGAKAPPSATADTIAAAAAGPLTPSPTLRQTPTDALISGNVAQALSKQAPGVAERIAEFLQRKA